VAWRVNGGRGSETCAAPAQQATSPCRRDRRPGKGHDQQVATHCAHSGFITRRGLAARESLCPRCSRDRKFRPQPITAPLPAWAWGTYNIRPSRNHMRFLARFVKYTRVPAADPRSETCHARMNTKNPMYRHHRHLVLCRHNDMRRDGRKNVVQLRDEQDHSRLDGAIRVPSLSCPTSWLSSTIRLINDWTRGCIPRQQDPHVIPDVVALQDPFLLLCDN
jgi:hypothetical protein